MFLVTIRVLGFYGFRECRFMSSWWFLVGVGVWNFTLDLNPTLVIGAPSIFGAPAAPQMGGGLFGVAQPQTGGVESTWYLPALRVGASIAD